MVFGGILRRLSGGVKQVTVVMATGNRDALEALADAEDILRREALTTQGLYEALQGAHLVVVDLEDLRESGVSRKRLSKALEGNSVLAVDGAAFAADAQSYLNQARAVSGVTGAPPPRTVALTNYSGGVGKTTLSLSLARAFREETRLPTAVIELSVGPSGQLALVGAKSRRGLTPQGAQGEIPHLYEVITQAKAWPTWRGITLAPMNWDTARLLDGAQMKGAWREIRDEHILTVLDVPAYHPNWEDVRPLADRVLAVATGRPDAVAGAVYLAQRDGYDLVLNQGAGAAARMSLEEPPAAELPDLGWGAEEFPPELGRPLLCVVYPGWGKR